jgi:hypothetical protein
MSINKQTVFAIFQDADNSQASFCTRLFNAGVFDKAQAVPLVIEFIEAKYEAKAKQGQRGLTFEKDTAPHTAMKRILANCFETVSTKPKTSNRTDPIDSLVSKFKKLSKAEQKRFLTSIA